MMVTAWGEKCNNLKELTSNPCPALEVTITIISIQEVEFVKVEEKLQNKWFPEGVVITIRKTEGKIFAHRHEMPPYVSTSKKIPNIQD